jgi:hypothetical protein
LIATTAGVFAALVISRGRRNGVQIEAGRTARNQNKIRELGGNRGITARMWRRIDNRQIDPSLLGLAEQGGELASVGRHRVQLPLVRTALIPAVGALLKSISRIAVLSSLSASQTAICTAIVVFPLPPFWEIIAKVLTTTTPHGRIYGTM